MNSAKLFIIEYALHGKPKSFIIRLPSLDNATAWHWAGCDAGVVRIGHVGRARPNVKKTSRPEAEKLGITQVTWRQA